jgi:UTP--glucose-1-phosphate uridylyltransferase
VVQDCLAAGIRDIYFVVGEDSTQIRQYFGRNVKLEKYLRQQGKNSELDSVKPPDGANFHYVKQPSGGKYGTTIPVALALQKTGYKRPVAVIMGDDFLYGKSGENDIARLLAAAENQEDAAMLGAKIPRSETANYGVIALNKQGDFAKIVEKPSPEQAPSNLINISKYVFPPKLQKLVAKYASDETLTHGGEYFITDPINEFVADGGIMKVVPNQGEYLDGGSLAGWLHANNVVAQDLDI